MFILRALLSFEARRGPRILIFSPTVWFVSDVKQRAEMTLEGGKSKSAGLKWQQCPSKWTLIVANIIQLCELCHYAMCNREEMKTLSLSHCNVFMFLAISKWTLCHALPGKNIINATMAGGKWYFNLLDL